MLRHNVTTVGRQVKKLCFEWFPILYPETWYRDITSDPRFYSLAAVYQSQLVGLIVAEIKHCELINKEVRLRFTTLRLLTRKTLITS